jgi:hypothetical protein
MVGASLRPIPATEIIPLEVADKLGELNDETTHGQVERIRGRGRL